MVSKNSDKIHNSSWGPQEKRLVLKHSLNIKETHIRLLITSKRISFRQHSSMSLSDIIQKTSTTGRLAGKPNPLFMTVTCCITITAVLKLGRYSSEIPPFGCAYKKKKKITPRNSPTNFLWHSRKFLPCCTRHLKIQNRKKLYEVV